MQEEKNYKGDELKKNSNQNSADSNVDHHWFYFPNTIRMCIYVAMIFQDGRDLVDILLPSVAFSSHITSVQVKRAHELIYCKANAGQCYNLVEHLYIDWF